MSPAKINPYAEEGWHKMYVDFKKTHQFELPADVLRTNPTCDPELLDFLVWWFRKSGLNFLEEKVRGLNLSYREALNDPQAILQIKSNFFNSLNY